jgi:anhydro-N-acetylmuramic acid kinase
MTLYLGLISGTSVDGIDAALLELTPAGVQVVHVQTTPYEATLRRRLLELVHAPRGCDLDEIGRLDVAVGRAFAAAALAAIDKARVGAAGVAAIGSHGQTLRHGPRGEFPFTWQIGDPNVIAERTGLTTVADFRRRDIAAGGEGAPLLPAFHRAVLADPGEARAVVNLGGIANVTWLPPRGETIGFDTGPANCLMDSWIERHRNVAMDRDGRWSASGNVLDPLLASMRKEPYFAIAAPKSTGRELFNLAWLEKHLAASGTDRSARPEDIQATLCELSAVTVATAIRGLGNPARVILCGGGAHNPELRRRLGAQLPGVRIERTDDHGINGDYVEAAGFAWFASRTLQGLPGNLPSVTGASHEVVLGAIHPGRAP